MVFGATIRSRARLRGHGNFGAGFISWTLTTTMLDIVFCIITCVSLLVANADSFRCRAIASSRRALGAVLLVVGVLKANTPSVPVALPPPPSKTWPLRIPPTQTVSFQTSPSLWTTLALWALGFLLIVAAVSRFIKIRLTDAANDPLPGFACVRHPSPAWYDIQAMLKTALPGPDALVDAPLARRRRCPEFWGSRSWKPLATFPIKDPVDPTQLQRKKTLGSGGFGKVIQVWSSQSASSVSKRRTDSATRESSNPSSATSVHLNMSYIAWYSLWWEI
ncbi:hypothetical protein C8R45DRAFT_95964 [Mycena sanguinolenta]|nr:hypothetical protein C8R45DRAFT_95964 [Mycena sanguinolenta]